jgi:SAM-dependent methyltransferase
VATGLLGREIPARLPTTYLLQAATDHERQRRAAPTFDATTYWTSYLGATRKNPLGFDVLALTDEYEALTMETVELLNLGPGERLLDLGCGTGNTLAATVRRWGHLAPGMHLEGVDLVPAALDVSRGKVRDAALECGLNPSHGFQVLDLSLLGEVTVLPYGAGSFDVVVLSLVLPYLKNPGPLLEQVRRVLRPGGRVVASTLRPDTDMGGPLQRLVAKIQRGDTMVKEGWQADSLLAAVQDYIHSAATLLDLEAEGRFSFEDVEAFEGRFADAGFEVVRTVRSFGDPPMGFVTLARRPLG